MNNQGHQPRNSLKMSRPVGSKGKFKSDIGLSDFWKYYRTTKKQLPHSKAESILKEVFLGFRKIMEEGDYIYIPNLGFYGVTIVDKKNPQKPKKNIDWSATWTLWAEQWPNANREEIIAIEKKPLVYFRNKTGLLKTILCNWWKMRRCHKAYMFQPTTEFSKVLGRACNEGKNIYMEKRAFEIRVGYLLEENRNRLKND